MRKVIYCLVPASVASVFFFGWVSLAMICLSLVFCVLAEWLFVRGKGGKVTEATLVTGLLFALTLPPTLPFYMTVLGAIFGVIFGKMAFGGFGSNPFNPALVGRAFLYITFPIHMANRWVPAADFSDFPAGFAAWRFTPPLDALSAITSATPSNAFRDGASTLPGYLQLFLGNINGQYEKLGEVTLIGGGSLGETSALLLLLGGLYLMRKKIADWRLVLSFFATYVVFMTVLHQFVPAKAPEPLFGLLTGGVMLGGFFMVTDPVSAAKTIPGKWVYGSLIAVLAVLIRSFSLFAGGIMFAILLGNIFGPIIDHGIREIQKRGKAG